MKTTESKALAAYLTAIASALAADMTREQRQYLSGYASAHLAGFAGLLNATAANGSRRDLSPSIDRDREMFRAYVVQLLNTAPVSVEDGAKVTALHDLAQTLRQ